MDDIIISVIVGTKQSWEWNSVMPSLGGKDIIGVILKIGTSMRLIVKCYEVKRWKSTINVKGIHMTIFFKINIMI